MITRQEIFDRAFIGLLRQGFEKASTGSPASGICQYRIVSHGKMLKCAIGQLIPDDKYHPRMDGNLSLTMDGKICSPMTETAEEHGFPLAMSVIGINQHDWSFCRHLQACHDNAHNPRDMLRRLIDFAQGNRLRVAVDVGSEFAQEATYLMRNSQVQNESRMYRPKHQGYPDFPMMYANKQTPPSWAKE